MKTTPITFDDLAASVIAVPPLARHADYSLNRAANLALIRSLEAGGVTSLMYGGNANFYHLPIGQLAEVLDELEALAADDTWVLPSVGADYGRMIDALPVLKVRNFPTVMVLPALFPTTTAGVERGICDLSDALGKPVILYIKREDYLTPEGIERLVNEGRVAAIKYAVVRKNPSEDVLLAELCQRLDKRYLISGIGERPVVEHYRDFGLKLHIGFGLSRSQSLQPTARGPSGRRLRAGTNAGEVLHPAGRLPRCNLANARSACSRFRGRSRAHGSTHAARGRGAHGRSTACCR
jgi:hypothetical protein